MVRENCLVRNCLKQSSEELSDEKVQKNRLVKNCLVKRSNREVSSELSSGDQAKPENLNNFVH